MKLWHVATGEELLSFPAGGGVAWSVAFSPDSQLLAFSSGSSRRGEIAFARAATENDVMVQRAANPPAGTQSVSPFPVPKKRLAKLIPPRDREAAPEMIDLTDFYNGSLTEGWIPSSVYGTTSQRNLGELPLGLQLFAGLRFDVRGVIQLAGGSLNGAFNATYPAEVNGIPVHQKCHRLHFLHATGWRVGDGTTIGRYVIHHARGAPEEVAIVYGENVSDWWFDSRLEEATANAVVAWTGNNAAARAQHKTLRLYKYTWENPKPDSLIESIDFVSLNTQSSPFLIAITAEP